MKKLLLAAILLIGGLSTQKASAQISLSINIGSQPAWAPTGYNHVDYYYLPDINSYYDVSNSQFIYPSGNRWITARMLPTSYGNYNIYNSYKVVVNRPTPYKTNRTDIQKYGKYKGHQGQPIIRDSKDQRYAQNRGNSKNDRQWVKGQKNNRNDNRSNQHGNGNHR